jgi:type II secretory pathway pseudopilin PulG
VNNRMDEGFSLVEVVVAMFLFMIVALAVLPLTVRVVSTSTDNRDLTAANSFAAARLAELRDQFGDEAASSSCAAVRARAHTGQSDPAGSGLASDLSVSSCPAQYPGTVQVTAVVKADGTTIVTMPTRILVTAP